MYCYKCGNEIENDAHFCSCCGVAVRKIDDSAPTTKEKKSKTRNSIYSKRIETNDKIVITWKPFSTWGVYIFLALFLVFGYLATQFDSDFFILMAILFFVIEVIIQPLIYVFSQRQNRADIKDAQKWNIYTTVGKKGSKSNPLTISIDKKSLIEHRTKEANDLEEAIKFTKGR